MSVSGTGSGYMRVLMNKGVWAALAIILTISPILYILSPSVWADDVGAMITEISPSRYPYYSVELTEPLPQDALNPKFEKGLWFPDVSLGRYQGLEGARVGEPITCHIRQVHGLNEMAIGPQTEITRCWR
jgi:hypothetical protein